METKTLTAVAIQTRSMMLPGPPLWIPQIWEYLWIWPTSCPPHKAAFLFYFFLFFFSWFSSHTCSPYFIFYFYFFLPPRVKTAATATSPCWTPKTETTLFQQNCSPMNKKTAPTWPPTAKWYYYCYYNYLQTTCIPFCCCCCCCCCCYWSYPNTYLLAPPGGCVRRSCGASWRSKGEFWGGNAS